MISSLILAAFLQLLAPKKSMLGEDKPWWTKLKKGDVASINIAPGYRIPLIHMWGDASDGPGKLLWSSENGTGNNTNRARRVAVPD
jgi:hypothetical protein